MDDIFKYEYKWGWRCQWMGWRRCLWLALLIDVKYWAISVVLFGVHVSWGSHLKSVALWNNTVKRVAAEDLESGDLVYSTGDNKVARR